MASRSWTWTVPPDSARADRADRAIAQAIEEGQGTPTDAPKLSRSQLQRLMEDGGVQVDGVPIRANTKLKAGSLVTLTLPEPKPLDVIPENRPLEILFEDAHLLVLNKPPGLTVHPSPTQMDGTLVNALLHHIKDLSGIGGKLRPGIVHRIDKDTSGALVITKSDAAHQGLAATFAKHDIERAYWALCYGSPKDSKGTIETRIGRNPSDRKKMAVLAKEGRHAISHYQVLERYGEANKSVFASFVEVRLETGRTHQVRVHLTHLGHSLLGDPVYGVPSERHPKWLALPASVRAAVEAMPGQALHARILGFRHPITGEKLHFEAEPPPEFAALLGALRVYC